MGRRVLAHVLDLSIYMGLTLAISIEWLGRAAPSSWLASPDSTFAWILAWIGLNWVLLQGVTGCSIGKAAFGVRVVDARGRPPRFMRGLLRTLPLVVEQWGIVGLFFVARSPVRQRLGDRWARTFVVRAKLPRRWSLSAMALAAVCIASAAWPLL